MANLGGSAVGREKYPGGMSCYGCEKTNTIFCLITSLYAENKDNHAFNNKFRTCILYNWYKCVIIMKFRIIIHTGTARYAYEKLQFPEFCCLLSNMWKLYQICFLKNIRTFMGLITNLIRESWITVVHWLY